MFDKMHESGANPRLKDLADKMVSESGSTLTELTKKERPQRILIKII